MRGRKNSGAVWAAELTVKRGWGKGVGRWPLRPARPRGAVGRGTIQTSTPRKDRGGKDHDMRIQGPGGRAKLAGKDQQRPRSHQSLGRNLHTNGGGREEEGQFAGGGLGGVSAWGLFVWGGVWGVWGGGGV